MTPNSNYMSVNIKARIDEVLMHKALGIQTLAHLNAKYASERAGDHHTCAAHCRVYETYDHDNHLNWRSIVKKYGGERQALQYLTDVILSCNDLLTKGRSDLLFPVTRPPKDPESEILKMVQDMKTLAAQISAYDRELNSLDAIAARRGGAR